MLQSNFEPFSKTGATFAVLSTEGKTPVMKERLNKSASCFEFSFFRKNNILHYLDIEFYIDFGILFGSEALLELREDMIWPFLSRIQEVFISRITFI